MVASVICHYLWTKETHKIVTFGNINYQFVAYLEYD